MHLKGLQKTICSPQQQELAQVLQGQEKTRGNPHLALLAPSFDGVRLHSEEVLHEKWAALVES